MQQSSTSDRADLHQAAEAFARWRQNKRTPQTRIPRELLQLACRLATVHGVSKTSRTLKVDRGRLTRLLNAGSDATSQSTWNQAGRRSRPHDAFVELPALTVAGVTECELQLENGQGIQLALRWRGSTAPDLSALSQLLGQG